MNYVPGVTLSGHSHGSVASRLTLKPFFSRTRPSQTGILMLCKLFRQIIKRRIRSCGESLISTCGRVTISKRQTRSCKPLVETTSLAVSDSILSFVPLSLIEVLALELRRNLFFFSVFLDSLTIYRALKEREYEIHIEPIKNNQHNSTDGPHSVYLLD